MKTFRGSLFARLICGVAAFNSLHLASAMIQPAALFQDHVVLQSGKPVPIWGQASPFAKVTVAFANQTLSTTADGTGAWQVVLAPLAVQTQPTALTISGENTVLVNDVLVGEVWLCSGQSNMAFPLEQVTNAEAEIAAANFPLIRQFQVHQKASNSPEKVAGQWALCAPAQARTFTAVGYFFARELTEKLGVPVGIINSTWGGTDIEAWMSPISIAENPELKFVPLQWQKQLDAYPANRAKFDAFAAEEEGKLAEAKARGETYTKRWHSPVPNPDGSPHQNKPSNLYNGMIHGLLPVAMRGILWYQGENNAERAAYYGRLFRALIAGWRVAFAQGDLPFYWVQLPNFRGNPATNDWVAMRAAQSAALQLPATGEAITIDVGEVENIHPKNKQDVGHRLALIALHEVYGQKAIFSGPRPLEIKFAPGAATITFTGQAGSLKTKGGELKGFELAGTDGIFHLAAAHIVGDEVIAESSAVPAPVAVRYGWHNAPEATLFNDAGLPAAPFCSDSLEQR